MKSKIEALTTLATLALAALLATCCGQPEQVPAAPGTEPETQETGEESQPPKDEIGEVRPGKDSSTVTTVKDIRSKFSHILVKDKGAVRTLFFVRDNGQEVLETAMDLEKPHVLIVPYTQAMFASHLFLDSVERVLIVGLGGGAMVRFLNHFFPETDVEAVEIDPEIVKIAADLFGTREGEHTHIFTEDAFEFLRRDHDPYDVIYMDAFLKPDEDTDATGVPLRLKTVAFFKSLRRFLKPNGLVVFNLNPHAGQKDDIASIGDAFDHAYVFPLTKRRNTVVVGSTTEIRASKADLEQVAEGLDKERDWGFKFGELAALLRE